MAIANEVFLKYTCANCQKFEKTFALRVTLYRPENSDVLSSYGTVMKFGEFPPFGPPTPARLIRLVGPDRDLFLKGRRCENQGLGIGAFIYYRRVVDNQRKRILLEIARVAERTGASPETVELFKQAADETQFAQAIERTKAAFPPSLLINGHNPLALLYAALSEAVHSRPDEECLAIASSIRIVLAELSERLGQALKDEVELRNALTTLMQKRTDLSDPE